MKIKPSGILLIGATFSAIVTFLVFITAKNNLFVALDDYGYIVNNANISKFDLGTILWSFTSFHEGNWHPLTMLSLAIDRYFWGINPFGFHLTNCIIHSCSIFFSCFLFSHLLKHARENRIVTISDVSCNTHNFVVSEFNELITVTGSIAAALFFALHPLRVESVVWASERKDVLCILFIILALLMYVYYCKDTIIISDKPFWQYKKYFLSLLFAALAIMSKPTAVSLPLILCLIDWYPLKRINAKSSLYSSLLEKIPFIIISLCGAVLTLLAQQIAMNYAPVVSWVSRLLVACKALLFYFSATIWPANLSAFYMHPGNVARTAFTEYIIYAFLVFIISCAAVYSCIHHRIWAAFWLYYVITLLPMLGIIQVGGQWAADRYSYLPSLGIALLWGGGVAYLCDHKQAGMRARVACFCIALALCQLIAYTALTVRQISVWRNTGTLATRIIDTSHNQSGAPYLARAIYRNESGHFQAALDDVGESMKIALRRGLTRTYPEIAFVQAVILKNLGRYAEALTILDWGIGACVDEPPSDAIRLRNEILGLAANNTNLTNESN